jgi:hypothetical protein
MIPLRIVLRCLCALAIAIAARAQAAVEYAAKSAAGAVSGSGASAHLGACRVDSTLIPCIRQFYPVAFYVAVAAICVFLWSLFRKSRV